MRESSRIVLRRDEPDRCQQLVDSLPNRRSVARTRKFDMTTGSTKIVVLARIPVFAPCLHNAVDLKRTHEVVVDAPDGIERGERVLKYQLHEGAISPCRRTPTEFTDLVALKEDPPRGWRVKPGKHPSDRAFSAPALSYQGGHPAGIKIEIDLVGSVEIFPVPPGNDWSRDREVLGQSAG